MAQVNVTINGRQFRMACEDGQEEHLHRLAKELDERVEGLRGQFGEIGDARLTIMAALMIADQLSETEGRIRALEQDVANLKQSQAAGAEHANATQAAIINALNAAAERIESVTRRLNETGGGSSVAQG